MNPVIYNEYQINQQRYKKGIGVIKDQLNHIFEERNLLLPFALESRIKTLDSIEDKLLRKNNTINSIEEIDDLLGIRIVCLLKEELPIITNIINENFNVLELEDTNKRLSVAEFGYESIHFKVLMKEEWVTSPLLKECKNLKFEFQLRTATQHIWAVVSHKLQYKHESDIPNELRRSMNSMSALLEICSNEFERLFIAREEFVKNNPFNKYPLDHPLDIELLKVVLDKYLPSKNKTNLENYSSLLEDLNYFNINTKDKLINLIENNISFVMKFEAARNIENNNPLNTPVGSFSGLTRLMLSNQVGQDAYIEYSRINPKMS